MGFQPLRIALAVVSLSLSHSPLLAVSTVTPSTDASTNVPTDWSTTVGQRIAESEYEVTWQPTTSLPGLESSWQAPNRAHEFRTYFTADGIRVIPRESVISWEWSLRLARWGLAGSTGQELTPARPRADKNRFEYNREALLESYVNDKRGLEQTFTIARAPVSIGDDANSGGLVHLDLALGGTLSPIIAADGQAIDFVTPQGARVLHYAELRVTDARGQVLRSWMAGFSEPGLRGIRIVYDDAGATYPITVDPLATNAAWTAESNQAGAGFGISAATAGDVNGDGFADVIIGAYEYDNGQADEGRAFVYLGSAAGLSASAAWTDEGNQAGALFGFPVATAGDVNGDGYSDVIVGAHGYDNGQTDEGRAFVYLGSAAGLSTTSAWTAESDQASALFGYSVATAGDINGDGYSDVIVGAYFFDNGQLDEGRAFVYLGSAAGLATSVAWTAESDQASAGFGVSAATAGDVNRDGYGDVVVGAYRYDNGQVDEGRAFVYVGSAAGLAATAAWTAESNQPSASFGNAVATAGDVNGDGYADVIVGAYLASPFQLQEGRAFVYLGSAAGLAANPAWTAQSAQADARFGTSVATAGDVNGDGYADVVVGAYLYGNGQTDEGRAYVYLGSSTGLATAAAWTAESDQASAYFGYSAATAGDVNGDGYADVIVGAYAFDNGQANEGRSYVYLGSAAGLATTAGWTAEGNQVGARFGHSVATAGDVNGDGYADVIVGAETYDNGQAEEGRAFVFLGSAAGLATTAAWTAESDQASASFGESVGTAGDVNGDGYSDVIVGAEGYGNGQAREGRAYVYLGSASGLAASAAWTAESDQAFADFGHSVATAGDVNGDGYADVIVGASEFDNGQVGEGRAYVYLGSAAGLATSAAWTADGNLSSAQFGDSVGTAGDVNGDGYADVIVGADGYNNGQVLEGRASVYLGSAAGLATGAAWAVESNRSSSSFGSSVATAGDVNGDGYADVIVSAYNYDNGQIDEGRAFVYLGSAAGLATSAAWTAEGDQTDKWFGISSATAGDINGDGYADVIVGATTLGGVSQTDEGSAFVYLGSAAGLATSAAWTAGGNQARSEFGVSVATAGDVNGDGYADVMVGAQVYDNGQADEGRVYVYYGNAGRGLSMNPRQRRTNDAVPIAHLGKSDIPDSFRLNLLGRTPFGRGLARLEWEVKPLGTLFNGSGVAVGAQGDTGTGATFSELATGLLGSTRHHWRVRLRYDAATTPFAQHSRWLTMPWKGWQEAMLATPPDPCLSGGIPIVCNDGNTCTTDTCNPAIGCVFTNNAASCNDGNACTTNDTCAAGSCVGGAPPVCNDGNACTNDSCNPATGCVVVNNAAACDDGSACTSPDTCQSGVCTGTIAVTCAALDQCHVAGTCNPQTGSCSNPAKADGSACTDVNACTQSDTCHGGACIGASPVVCTASDQCHVIGTCNPANGVCSDPVAPNGTGCNDGNPCLQTDTCQAGSCVGANPVFCVALDQCHVAGVCQAVNGQCSNPTKADGTICDDGNSCTAGDACSSGACGGTAGTVPGDVVAVTASKSGPTVVFSWNATAEASAYGMLRGRVRDWPVGSNPATETCLSANVVGATGSDGTVPATGDGYWYLFRAENGCGGGSYGSRASHGVPTEPRLSETCP